MSRHPIVFWLALLALLLAGCHAAVTPAAYPSGSLSVSSAFRPNFSIR